MVETGPKSKVDNVLAGLEKAGIDEVDWIVPTHIHLDHAGAAGTLAGHFPQARIAVHPIGAPHLVDPSKLWTSATRIYGDRMEEMWGGIDPVPADRITTLADGDVIDLGGRTLKAIETPGHARHHHCLLDDATGIVFTGDALGVRLPQLGVMRPTTPPPEFNLEDAVASIERLRSLGPTSLWPTHFGPIDAGEHPIGVDEACSDGIDVLRSWADIVKGAMAQAAELDEVTAIVATDVGKASESRLDPDQISLMEQTSSYSMNTWGYMRYLEKAGLS